MPEKSCIQDVNPQVKGGPEYLVLLHGLGRSRRSMNRLGSLLGAEGYAVVNIGYPSRRYPVETLARLVRREIDTCCPDRSVRINFVTHSLGGIILRWIQKYDPLPNLGRVVMLAPPNSGSEVAEYLRRGWFFRQVFGPVLSQLGTAEGSLPLELGPADFAPGVIAGSRMPWFGGLFRGPSDGLVSVERAKLAGMADFIVIPCSHTFIMNSRETAAQAGYFLRHGQFDHHTASAREGGL